MAPRRRAHLGSRTRFLQRLHIAASFDEVSTWFNLLHDVVVVVRGLPPTTTRLWHMPARHLRLHAQFIRSQSRVALPGGWDPPCGVLRVLQASAFLEAASV